MPRSGGTYTLPAGNPVVTGTVGTSAWANGTMSDVGTELTNSIPRDGTAPPTANMPMGNFRHTGAAAGAATTDYARLDQAQNSGLQYLTSVAGTNTITGSAPITPAAYAAGQVFRFITAVTNTGAVTLNVNSLGARDVRQFGTGPLASGDLVAGAIVEVIYDGTLFQVQTPKSPLTSTPFFNRFANGGMRFDQTNSSGIVTVNSASQFPLLDCVEGFGVAAAGTFTVQQIGAGSPPGYSAFTRVTRGTQDAAPAAGSIYQVVGLIEGLDIADLQWQSANALAVSYQFMFRTSLTGPRTWGGSIRNAAGARSYPVTWTTEAANVWKLITLPNIPGDTAGTWLVDNQRSMLLTMDVGSGATLRGTANAWAASNLVGVTGTERLISSAAADTFDFTGIQLERGPVCTSFETMPFPAQEIRVFRYLRRRRATGANQMIMAGTNNTTAAQQFYADPLPVHMRIGPSVSYSASGDFTVYTNSFLTVTAVSLTAIASDPTSVMHQTLNSAMGAATLTSLNSNAFILYAARL